jgi:hypothetical protein
MLPLTLLLLLLLLLLPSNPQLKHSSSNTSASYNASFGRYNINLGVESIT